MLSADNKQQLWIPPRFAHGFVMLTDTAELLYKTTGFHAPQSERCIAWDEQSIGVDWHFESQPRLSSKDMQGKALAEAEVFG